jgi:hypothetical protein
MYCSTCGVVVAQGLSYCNYCGAKVSGAKGDNIIKSPEVRPESLVGAMVCAFVFGLVAISVLIGMMKAVLHLEVGVILFFTLVSFLIMLSLEGVFIRLLLRSKRGVEKSGDAMLSKGQSTNDLDAVDARVLPAPMPSVTEHTTRPFEPTYSERTSK